MHRKVAKKASEKSHRNVIQAGLPCSAYKSYLMTQFPHDTSNHEPQFLQTRLNKN